MRREAVAVFDVGKTNAKLCAVAADSGRVVANLSRPLSSLPGPPYAHLDTEGLWSWLVRGLATLSADHELTAIVATAHGATAALIDDQGLVLPVLDYEDPGPDLLATEYTKVRPPFCETLSPPLPASLNCGRGVFWLSQAFAGQFARARHILSYTQYWSWRLCGVQANECTTIGSHTDLWLPREGRFSSLVHEMGWGHLFPPLRRADEVLEPVSKDVARATGLPPDCKVLCGIHDSNASLIPWIDTDRPFTVSSTGTWVINLSLGADLDRMDPGRDCAANVSIRGEPIACSRWMGGRERELLTNGCEGHEPSVGGLAALIGDEDAMLLPNQGGQGGPYWGLADHPNENLSGRPCPERVAAADLYSALMLDMTFDLCNSKSRIIVEGSFSRNLPMLAAVAALRDDTEILVSDDLTGTTAGAARLALPSLPAPKATRVEPLEDVEAIKRHRDRWRDEAGELAAAGKIPMG